MYLLRVTITAFPIAIASIKLVIPNGLLGLSASMWSGIAIA